MKRIHLNAFKIAGVGHTAVGLWRHPQSQAHRYKDLDYWTSTARTLEAGLFDSLFIADFPGIYDVYKQSPDAALRDAIAVPLNDPLMAVSAMAAVTERLGFGLTVSTTYEQPYSFARKMTTLDHLTKGRVGWNIVTSVTQSAARNLGLDKQVPHDERYAIADEFMDAAYKLWEGSWEDDAVVNDPASGVFVDPAKVHPTAHAGKYFRVPDPFLCEPSIQRTPTLFQAGASAAGKTFAARHAEAVFLVDPTVAGMAKLTREVRGLAAGQGRRPDSLKFMAGVCVVVAETDAAAEAKFRDYLELYQPGGHAGAPVLADAARLRLHRHRQAAGDGGDGRHPLLPGTLHQGRHQPRLDAPPSGRADGAVARRHQRRRVSHDRGRQARSHDGSRPTSTASTSTTTCRCAAWRSSWSSSCPSSSAGDVCRAPIRPPRFGAMSARRARRGLRPTIPARRFDRRTSAPPDPPWPADRP